MDLTDLFHECLLHANYPRRQKAVTPPAFVKEAQSVVDSILQLRQVLQSIRSAYLADSSSRHALSEPEKDEMDYEATRIARQCKQRIENMQGYEMRRRAKERGLLASIFRQTEAKRTFDTHRDAIIVYLRTLLQKVVRISSEQQEQRTRRQEEKSRSVLYTNTPVQTTPVVNEEAEAGLSTDELLQLQTENDELVAHFENVTERAQELGKTLLEIDALQTEIAQQLLQQGELTEQLHDDATTSNVKVSDANLQLDQARQKNRRSTKIVCMMTYGIALLLLLLHAIG